MFTLSTNIELPIAHRLPDAYSGLCVGNIDKDGKETHIGGNWGVVHGHNYIITFDISTNVLNDDFMVMDFKQIKKLIHEEMDKYDHSLILEEMDDLIDFYREKYKDSMVSAWEYGQTRVYAWPVAPTAEYMAYKWYQDCLAKFKGAGIKVSQLTITVEETSHNKVSYTEGLIND